MEVTLSVTLHSSSQVFQALKQPWHGHIKYSRFRFVDIYFNIILQLLIFFPHIFSLVSTLPPSTPRSKFVSYETVLYRSPALTTCPSCQTQVTTQVTYQVGTHAWLMCLMFVLCGWGELMIQSGSSISNWHRSEDSNGKDWCIYFISQIAAWMLPDPIFCELFQGCLSHLSSLSVCPPHTQENMLWLTCWA